MKLFARKDALADVKKAEEAIHAEDRKVVAAIQKKIGELNTLEEKFAKDEREKVARLAQLDAEATRRISSLTQTVLLLEERRKEALKPLTEEENRISGLLSTLAAEMDELDARAKALYRQEERFHAKEATFAKQEQMINEGFKAQEAHLQRFRQEAEGAKTEALVTTQNAQKAKARAEAAEKKLHVKRQSLEKTIRDISLDRIAIKKARTEIETEKKRLASWEARLTATWNEIKRYGKD